MSHVSIMRPLLSVTIAVALSALGTAQNFIVGGPGHSVLKGSGDSDLISDPSGGDSDILYDFDRLNQVGDGSADTLNARDGDSNDRMVGGPEDTFIGDVNDWVEIRQHGTLRWQGTYRQYRRIKRMISWLITEACPDRCAPTVTASHCTPRCSCPPASSSSSSICVAM